MFFQAAAQAGVLDLAFLTTIMGGTLLTSALTELVKRAWDPPADIQDRFIPLVAIALGISVVVGATFFLDLVTRLDIGNAIVTGLFAGLASCGLYDAVQGVRGK